MAVSCSGQLTMVERRKHIFEQFRCSIGATERTSASRFSLVFRSTRARVDNKRRLNSQRTKPIQERVPGAWVGGATHVGNNDTKLLRLDAVERFFRRRGEDKRHAKRFERLAFESVVARPIVDPERGCLAGATDNTRVDRRGYN